LDFLVILEISRTIKIYLSSDRTKIYLSSLKKRVIVTYGESLVLFLLSFLLGSVLRPINSNSACYFQMPLPRRSPLTTLAPPGTVPCSVPAWQLSWSVITWYIFFTKDSSIVPGAWSCPCDTSSTVRCLGHHRAQVGAVERNGCLAWVCSPLVPQADGL
jgi:hypothetical protein